MQARSTLFFVRVTAQTWWDREAFKESLRWAFNIPEPHFVEYRRRRWTTCDFRETPGGKWLFGIAKLRDDVVQRVLETDDEGHRHLREAPGTIVPSVLCLFDPERSLLISETNSEVRAGAVMSVLRRAIQMARRERGDDIGEPDIHALVSQNDFDEWLQKVDRITYLHFRVKPSNPHSKDLWRELDELVRESSANHVDVNLSAKDSDAGVDANARLPRMALGQVNAGYGTAYARGFRGAVPFRWESKEHLIVKDVDRFEDPEEIEKNWLQMANAAEEETSEWPKKNRQRD